MTNFTNEQTKDLMAQAKTIMDSIAEGESVRNIMADLYVKNLDDKTIQQGQVMADAILEAVKNFDAGYKEAQEDLDGYIKKFQKKVDEGKTCVERCNYWMRLAAAIAAANEAMDKDGADRQAILQEIENLSVSEEEANEALEKELREKARDVLKDSGILLTGLMAQGKDLQQMANADETAGLLIDLGNDEIEYRAIIAMLAYTKVKTGELENIPVDMTAAQVANLVCAQVEHTRILEGVGNGTIPMAVAEVLLNVLGIAVLAVLALAVTSVAIPLATGAFWILGGALLAIPAMLVTVALILRGFDSAMDAWLEDSKKIIKKVSAAIKWVVKGITAVVEYIKDNVLPVIQEKAKQLLQQLRGKFHKPETVAVPTKKPVSEVETEEVVTEEPVVSRPVAEPKLETVAIG